MRYDAQVQAYDCLDLVQVVGRVWLTDQRSAQEPVEVIRLAESLRGQGETRADRWLEAALLGLLEAL